MIPQPRRQGSPITATWFYSICSDCFRLMPVVEGRYIEHSWSAPWTHMRCVKSSKLHDTLLPSKPF